MPRESIQQKLSRVRAPRVHLTYEIEAAGAIERHELPFVLGVLGNFSGQAATKLPFTEHRFIDVDRDSFDEVLRRIAPRVALVADDRESGGADKIDVALAFASLDDFEPASIARRASMSARHLDAVLHAPPFQRLEATWRGLHYLVNETETSSMLKLRIFDVAKSDLLKDSARAPSFYWPPQFKKIYDDVSGRSDGEPVDLLLGDYEFSPHPSDVALLERLAEVAAAANSPFVAAASPAFFNLTRFSELGGPRSLAKIVDAVEFTKWRAFRESENAHYVGLTLPRILLRRPHVAQLDDGRIFEERIETPDDLLWGNTAYALGACVTNAFAKYGWCAAIQGVESGGLVEGLPTVATAAATGDAPPTKGVTDVLITDRREKELADLGFIPLLDARGRDYAVFFSIPSCAKPKSYNLDAANANSRLWAQLKYVLTASRFGHYIRVLVQRKSASVMAPGDLEHYLQDWLGQYVLQDLDASIVEKAKYPLAEATVNVDVLPDRPGGFRAVVYLRPHFQLDELSVSLRLIVDLPAAP